MATVNLGKVKVINRGEYDPIETYRSLDIVREGPNWYFCEQEVSGEEPSESAKFSVFVEATSSLEDASEAKFATALAVKNLQDNKVEKEDGKGLSEENFTTLEKTKLSNTLAGDDERVVNAVQTTREVRGVGALAGGGTLKGDLEIDASPTTKTSLEKADTAVQTADFSQESGQSEFLVMSQKAVTDALGTKVAQGTLGNSATRNVGTSAGMVAAGNDTRIVNAVQRSEVGNAASLDVGVGPGTVAAGNDTRIVNAVQRSEVGNSAARDVGTSGGTVAAGNDARIVNAVQKDSLAQLRGVSLTTATSQNFVTEELQQLESELQQLEDSSQTEEDVLATIGRVVPLGDSISYEKDSDETYRHAFAGLAPQKAMRRCVLSDEGEVVYYLDKNDSTLQEDGITPAVLDGTDGQVMVEIPLTYVRSVDIGTSYQWATSLLPLPGFVIHPAFTEGGTFEYNESVGIFHYANPTRVANYIYVGAYQASVFSSGTYLDGLNLDNNTTRVTVASDKLASVSGKYPMVGLTRSEFRTLASNRGTDWSQLDFWTQSLLQILFFVEYADLNSQRALGTGNTEVSGGYSTSSNLQTDSPHSRAGKSDKVGNVSGSVESTSRDTAWVSFRGIENWFGNAWQWTDGINVNNRAWYASNTPPFVDDTSSGYVLLGTAPSANGYPTAIHPNIPGVVPLSTAGGSSSTAFGDYYYQNTGWRVLRVGGSAEDGALAGACCWFASTSSSLRYRKLSARLLFKKF